MPDLEQTKAEFRRRMLMIARLRSFKASFENELEGLQVPAIDATGAIGSLKEGLVAPAHAAIEEVKADVATIRQSITTAFAAPVELHFKDEEPLAREQAIPFRNDSTRDRQEMKAKLTFDEKDIRANVARAINVSREELRQKNLSFQVAPLDANAEARQRFAGTANQAGEEGGGGFERASRATGDWLNKAVQARIILEAIRGGVNLIGAGIDLWKAHQAEVNGQMDKAAAGYIGFAETVKNTPIVGEIVFKAANLLSGGAMEAAQGALKDAADNDQHSKDMVDHNEATDAAKLQAARAQAEAQGGDEGEFKLAVINRDEIIKKIQEEVKAKQVSAEVGKELVAAEFAKTSALFDAQQAKRVKAAQEEQDRQKKAAEAAKEAAQRPFNEAQKQVATFGMSAEDKAIFDFKADKTHTDDAIKRYTDLINQVKQLKADADLKAQVDAWHESLKGPQERYKDILATLDKLHKNGMSDADFAKAKKNAGEELNRQLQSEQPAKQTALAGAVTAGSADAVRMQFNAQRDSEQTKLQQQQITLAQQQAQSLTQIVTNTGNTQGSQL